MTRNQKFLAAGIAAATVSLAAVGAVASRGGDWGHGGWRHHGGGGMGYMGGAGFMGSMGRICRGDAGEMADHMLVHIEHKVKPTEAQKAPFEDFKTATRQAAEKMRSACPKETADKDADAPKTRPSPIERLARAQTGLEASLEAIKIVRPAAEKFYASLTDEQKAKLTQPRGPRFGNRGPGPKGGPDGDKDDGAETPAPAPRN